jgi:hypothetical protein
VVVLMESEEGAKSVSYALSRVIHLLTVDLE